MQIDVNGDGGEEASTCASYYEEGGGVGDVMAGGASEAYGVADVAEPNEGLAAEKEKASGGDKGKRRRRTQRSVAKEEEGKAATTEVQALVTKVQALVRGRQTRGPVDVEGDGGEEPDEIEPREEQEATEREGGKRRRRRRTQPQKADGEEEKSGSCGSVRGAPLTGRFELYSSRYRVDPIGEASPPVVGEDPEEALIVVTSHGAETSGEDGGEAGCRKMVI